MVYLFFLFLNSLVISETFDLPFCSKIGDDGRVLIRGAGYPVIAWRLVPHVPPLHPVREDCPIIVMAYNAEPEVVVSVCDSFFVEKYARFNLISIVVAGLRNTCAILEQIKVEIDVIMLREDFSHGFEIYRFTDLYEEFRPAVLLWLRSQVYRVSVCVEVLFDYFKPVEMFRL